MDVETMTAKVNAKALQAAIEKRVEKKPAEKPPEKRSPKAQQAIDARRIARVPLLLSGVQPGKHVTIKPDKFSHVDIDVRYQRTKIQDSVNDLVYVLQHGGDIPDPITCVKRTFVENGQAKPSDKLWVIDGQQRFMAHLELWKPIEAIVHEVDSFEAERAFFLVMNMRRAVNASTMVHSWPGACGDLLRLVNQIPSHSLYGRVGFGGGSDKLPAAILVRGIIGVCGLGHAYRIEHMLNRADSFLEVGNVRPRVEAYLSLAGRVFPTGSAPVLAVRALGEVCRERWAELISTPPEPVIERLRKVNWKAEVPSYADRYRPLVEAHIKRIWK